MSDETTTVPAPANQKIPENGGNRLRTDGHIGSGVPPAEPEVLDGSEGVCLRHVRTALRRGSPGAEHVLHRTRSAIERLLGELGEVIRKEDYRFRHEPRTDAERTAPSRAVARIAGADGLVDTASDG